MKRRNLLLILILVLGLLMTTVQAQDTPTDKNPFLLTTSQTDGWLNAAFAKQPEPQPTASLNDPGPVWQGLTDTTAFNERMNKHIYRSDLKIDRLKKQLRGNAPIESAENKALRYLTAEQELENARLLARATLNAHPGESFRNVAQQWESTISEKLGQLNTDHEVYFYLTNIDSSELSPEMQYILNQKLTNFERNGVMLSKEKRVQVTELKSKITTFGNRFTRNIFNTTPTLTIHKDSLSGLPAEWIEQHSMDEQGFVRISLTNPNMNQLAFNADREYARRAAMKGFYTKSHPHNFAVLDSLRSTRHELAQLLGYDSWAHYSAEPLMTKSPQRIQKFLSEITTASKRPIEDEIDQLLQIKEETHPTAEEVDWTDIRYLQNKVKAQSYNFNTLEMKEYLPYEQVKDGVLTTAEELYEIDIRSAPQLPKWSPAVEPYEIFDEGNLIGRIYLDMHPREGKFGGAGNFPLRMGNNTVPETTLLVGMLGGTPNDPGRLVPEQVNVIFHEFGHALHRIFMGGAPAVGEMESDFIEAPSQLFEKWAKDPQNLSSFARHYKTGNSIPEELMEAYHQSEQFGRAIQAQRQIEGAALSLQLYHNDSRMKPVKKIENEILDDHLMYKRPEWFHPSIAYPHFYPYSSNLYTYLWSDVIARDLFTVFDSKDLLNPETGKKFREMILAKSGTAPMEELIEEFLGRPFNANAWQAWLNGDNGLTTTQTDS